MEHVVILVCKYMHFHSCSVHPDIIKYFIYPTECTTRLKFILKFLH